VPEVIHPDPRTTILIYRTRRAWRFVVLQTVRVVDGVVIRTPHRWILHIDEPVVVEDAMSRVVARRFLYPFSEIASPVEVFTPKVAPLIRVYLNENVHVADGVTPNIADLVERVMQESVDVADGVSRTIIDDLIKRSFYEIASPVDAMSETLADLVTKTLPESVAVVDGVDRTVVDRIESIFPEIASPVDAITTTVVPLEIVQLGEQVKVSEGGVENPPPEDPEAEYTWWIYRLGEKILIADQITYEITVVVVTPLYEDIKVYPWAGTAVLDDDPAYSYTAEVSEVGTDYVEVGYFDFDEDEADIKGVFVNLVWAQKITGAGSGKVKWQAASGSHASPGEYVDITDEVSETLTDYNDHARSGVIHKITDFSSQMPITIRCMVKNVDATSAEAKIKSNSYIRAAYKRVE